MFLSHNFSSATRDSRLLLASGNRHLMAALSTDTFHIHMYSTLAVLCAHCIRLSFSLFLARALTFAVSSSMHSGTMTNFSGVTFNADLWIHFFSLLISTLKNSEIEHQKPQTHAICVVLRCMCVCVLFCSIINIFETINIFFIILANLLFANYLGHIEDEKGENKVISRLYH